jgi:hypothetical protein
MIDGFYAVVHQQDGWPRQLVGPETAASLSTVEGADTSIRGSFTRLRQWLGIAA